MRVDQAGRDQGAAQVLHVVDVDDVVDDAGQARRELRRRTGPGNPITLHENGSIAPYLRTGPQPADIGQESERHAGTPCLARMQAEENVALLPPAMNPPAVKKSLRPAQLIAVC